MNNIAVTERQFFEIFHHPGLYQEFITPIDERGINRLPMKDWLVADHWGKVRLYQYPALAWDHMLPAEVPIEASRTPGYEGVDRISVGRLHDWGGRSTSKSFNLEHDVLQSPLLMPSKQSLLTSRDDSHLEARWEAVLRYAEHHPLLSLLVESKRRGDPYGSIMWTNGHRTQAVYESTSGEGDPYVGKKYHRAWFDEFQLTSAKAWEKFHDAQQEEGCVIRTTGVSDGRLDTPAHAIRVNPDLERFNYEKSQFVTERWTPKAKKEAKDKYGGEDSQGYITNVKGGEGEPTSAVWDMNYILNCMATNPQDIKKPVSNRRKVICPVVSLSSKQIQAGKTINEITLPAERGEQDVWLSMDVGKRLHPSVIGVIGIDKKLIPYLWGMIVLWHIEYRDQAKIIKYIINYYGASKFGIDHTGGGGDAILEHLTLVMGCDIIPVHFGQTIERPVEKDRKWGRKKKNPKDKHAVAFKSFTTVRLQSRFADGKIELLDDFTLRLEFQTEVAKVTQGRYSTSVEKYVGPKGDHIIDMFRILEYMLYLAVYKNIKNRPMKPSIVEMGGRLIELGKL